MKEETSYNKEEGNKSNEDRIALEDDREVDENKNRVTEERTSTSEDESQEESEEEFEEGKEEENRLSKEDPISTVVQTWTNPLFNPDPPHISNSSETNLSLVCRENKEKGEEEQSVDAQTGA